MPGKSNTDRADRAALLIHGGFVAQDGEVREVTRRAALHFRQQDWQGMQADARRRAGIYPRHLQAVMVALQAVSDEPVARRSVWREIKRVYTSLMAGRPNVELARTFFNSVSRQVFKTVGVDAEIEFLATEIPALPRKPEATVHRRFEGRRPAAALVADILGAHEFAYADLVGDAGRVAQRLEEHLRRRVGEATIDWVEMAGPVFYRNKGAYLIGRLRTPGQYIPLVLPLLQVAAGVAVDALLAHETEVSILFSFTRSCFHVDTPCPRDLIVFLRSIMPLKPVAELYISLGFERHGKTEIYRALQDHLSCNQDRFEIARGDRGLVMVVFTLSRHEMVFKVIRDRFARPKSVTHRQVRERYRLVFNRDRVGRLVDAQEFEHLRLPLGLFSRDVLDELRQEASESIGEEGGDMVIHHLYTERKLTPLNLYLRQADGPAARLAVIDYGLAIKNLAAANIFPGDFLLKNFGVTRHGRVVFYDYDELCLLTDCRFREMPEPRTPEEEMASEPWFRVGENDIFPEEFERFLGLPDPLRQIFRDHHGDLFTAGFWIGLQESLRRGEIMDFFPYPERRRLHAGGEDDPG